MSDSVPAIVDTDAFEHVKRVADLYVSGVTSPFTLARRLGMKVVEVRAALETWHTMIQNDTESQDQARDALNVMLQRYDVLLVEANNNLDNLKSLGFDEKVSAQINTTIKVIGELDSKRVDLLQKAGLLDAHDLGDELAEREEREQMLIGILRDDLCPDCRMVVARKLQQLTNKVEATVVYDE